MKLGELFLLHGRWHGRQLVPAAWVRASTKTVVTIPDGYAYGYLWWVNTGPHGGYAALGYGGQMVAVYPRLDLVIVTTGSGKLDEAGVARQLLRAVRD